MSKLKDRLRSNHRGSWRNYVKTLFMTMIIGSIFSQAAFAQLEVTKFIVVNHAIINFSTLADPTTSINLSATGVDPFKANVNWSLGLNADSYQLEHLGNGSVYYTVVYQGSESVFVAENLIPGPNYFRISTCNNGSCSVPVATVQVNIQIPDDTDADGVYDVFDICPNTLTFLAADAQGCSERQRDTDQDGVNDAYDLCPGTASTVAVSAAGCAPTTDDTDNDGVTDDIDYCDATASGDPTVDGRGCGQDQYDADNDGTPDYQDPYPHQNNTQCSA